MRCTGFPGSGFSCYSAQLRDMGSVASQHVGSFPTRDPSRVPCIGRQILNCWTTREVPRPNFSWCGILSILGFPGGTGGRESAYQCRRHKRCQFNPWVGKIPWRRAWAGNPLQYSCLENPTDRGAWWATVHGVTKSWTRLKQLSVHMCACTHTHTESIVCTCVHAHTHSQ